MCVGVRRLLFHRRFIHIACVTSVLLPTHIPTRKLKKKNMQGVGITIPNSKMYSKGFRPLLPLTFRQAYPKLCQLVYKCWSQEPAERPVFDEIVRALQGDVGEEVKRKAEPTIVFLSKQPDKQYLEEEKVADGGEGLMGDDDEEDNEEGNFVSRKELEEVKEKYEKAMEETRRGFEERERDRDRDRDREREREREREVEGGVRQATQVTASDMERENDLGQSMVRLKGNEAKEVVKEVMQGIAGGRAKGAGGRGGGGSVPMTLLMMALVFLGVLVDRVEGDMLLVSGICQGFLNVVWLPAQITASGRWSYMSAVGVQLYYDEDCSGTGMLPAGWFFDTGGTQPDLDAEFDLDGDGTCSAIGFIPSHSMTPPSGEWNVNCDGWEKNDVSIEMTSGIMCGKGEGPVGVPVQDMDDPCACDIDGFVNNMLTYRPTCRDHVAEGSGTTCYVLPECEAATESSDFPGTKWRPCDPVLDNHLAYHCEPCPPGHYSIDNSPGKCLPCAANEYNPNEGATDASACLPCPSDTPWSEEGSASCSPPPESCVRLSVEGCGQTTWGASVSGEYEIYEGECGDATEGRPVYLKELTGSYLFHRPHEVWWKFGDVCGSTPIHGWGVAGSSPFEGTAPTWECVDVENYVPRPMSISCSLYSGQASECKPGTYSPTGTGIEGACTTCPAHLESSRPGSKSVDDCFTTRANAFVSCWNGRVTVYDSDSDDHQLVWQGLGKLADAVFISGTTLLTAAYDEHTIFIPGVDGGELGVFANVGNPRGLLFLEERRLIAVASQSGGGYIHVFSLDDFQDGKGLEIDDVVGSVDMEELGVGDPGSISRGERDDEILFTTSDNKVVRHCVPATSCTSSSRNSIMLRGGLNFRGLGPILSRNTYVVVDRNADRVYECPMASSGVYLDSCSVFAYMPGGVYWDPNNLLVDEEKGIVYVVDTTPSIIHLFSLDGDYFGLLAQDRTYLDAPTAIAIKPGPLAAISPISPPPSATAGEAIIVGMALRTDSNKPLPPDYTIEEELRRFSIAAMGLREGAATTLQGAVNSASELSIVIKYAGVWEIAIIEGTKNPQHLMGSPFQITVEAAETDPSECEAEFERVLTAGDEFVLNIAMMDAFLNPTEGAEFSFSCCVGEAMTKAGEYLVDVTPAIKGNPFRFDVKPDAPDAATSAHNIVNGAKLDSRSLHTVSLELRVTPLDKFNNTITDATGYAVSIDGDDDVALSAPDFSYTLTIEEGFEGSISLSFTLNGEDIKNSPTTISVAPDSVPLVLGVIGGVLALHC